MNNPLPQSAGVFDPTAFASMPVEGVGSTAVTPLPAGEYLALIGDKDTDVRPVPFQDQKTGESRLRLDVAFNILDDSGALRAQIDGRDPRHIQGIFCDLIPGTWQLDMGKGKNVTLNKLREAVGQNTGAPWVYTMLRGAGPLKINVTMGPDKQDNSIMRNNIKSFGKPSA